MTEWGPGDGPRDRVEADPGGGGGPRAEAGWSPSGALEFAWQRIRHESLRLVLVVSFGYVLMLAPTLLSTTLTTAYQVNRAFTGYRAGVIKGFDPLDPFVVGVTGGGLVAGWVAMGLLWGGLTRVGLNAARGQRYGVGDLFEGTKFFGSALTVGVASGLPSLLGLVAQRALMVAGFTPFGTLAVLASFVPTMALVVLWWFAMPLVVDRGLGGFEALRESVRMTRGHRLNIILLFLLVMAAAMIGVCLCGVGIFGAMALQVVAQGYVYLRVTGQPTAATTGG